MLRRVFLVAILAISVGLFGQTYTSPGLPAGMNQPTSVPVVVAPASPSIYIVGGGTYGTGVYLTPAGTLPVQNTGISFAGRAGISLESPLQTGTVTFLPNVIPGTPIYGAAPTAGYTGAETTAESGRLINDMGPSYYVSAGAAAPPVISLGEVAAQYKAQHPQSVRSFTNADAQRLANTVTITGAAVAVVVPQTQPQAAEKPPSGTAPPQASETAPTGEPQVSAEKAAPGTLPPVLPATSTLLPLLGLLGLAISGVGLLIGRLRR